MENKAEDEVRKRWEQEARDKALREQRENEERPRKRMREIEYERREAKGTEGGLVTPDEETASDAGTIAKAGRKGRRKVAATGSTRGSRAKGRITEIVEDDEDYVELD